MATQIWVNIGSGNGLLPDSTNLLPKPMLWPGDVIFHIPRSGSTLAQVMTWCLTAPSHYLTHWGRVTHICVGNLTTIGSDNGLSPGRRQAIIWTNAGLLLIGPLGTNFSEILIRIQTFSFKKMHLEMSSAKWRPFCLALNVLINTDLPSKIFWGIHQRVISWVSEWLSLTAFF